MASSEINPEELYNKYTLTQEDYSNRCRLLQEFLDHLEIASAAQYRNVWERMLPAFLETLEKTQPQMENNQLHQIRNLILKIFQKLPNNEVLRNHLSPILLECLRTIKTDNEDNAVIAMKTLTELHKSYKNSINKEEVAPFIEFACGLYHTFADKMDKFFNLKNPDPLKEIEEQNIRLQQAANLRSEVSNQPTVTITRTAEESDTSQHRSTPLDTPPLRPGGLFTTTANSTNVLNGVPPATPQIKSYKPILPSVDSFKVIAESGIPLVLILTLYEMNLNPQVRDIIPYMINSITYMPKKEEQLARPHYFLEFIPAINKTLSFIGFLLRIQGYAELLTLYGGQIAKSIINMLKNCPKEAVKERKALLSSLKFIHMKYLKDFVEYYDDLCNEEVLFGTDKPSLYLKREGYCAITNIIFNIRNKLDFEQIKKSIYLLTKVLNDPNIQIHIQNSQIYVLTHLVSDNIINHGRDEEEKKLLREITGSITSKLGSLSKLLKLSFGRRFDTAQRKSNKEHKQNELFEEYLNQNKKPSIKREESQITSQEIPSILIKLEEGEECKEKEKIIGGENVGREIKLEGEEQAMESNRGVEVKMEELEEENKGLEKMVDDDNNNNNNNILMSATHTNTNANTHNNHKREKGFKKKLLFYCKDIWGEGISSEQTSCEEMQNEINLLVQKMIGCLQTVVRCLTMSQSGITYTEMHLFSTLFRKGIQFFIISHRIQVAFKMQLSSEDEKPLKSFIEVFLRLDLQTFKDLMQKEMQFLFDSFLGSETPLEANLLYHIPQKFKEERKRENFMEHARTFSQILFAFLINNLQYVGLKDYKRNSECVKASDVILKLFKFAFDGLQPLTNEPELNNLFISAIIFCIKNSRKAKFYASYIYFIKSIFRTFYTNIGVNQSDTPIEFMPMCPGIFQLALELKEQIRFLEPYFIEMCIFFPIKLKFELPYLRHLIKPVVEALYPVHNELITTGYKTIEHWLSALSPYPETLQPLIEPMHIDLINLVYKLLGLSFTVYKLLGKLGGLNRLYMVDRKLHIKLYPEDGIRMIAIDKSSGKSIKIGLDSIVESLSKVIEEYQKLPPSVLKNVFTFLKASFYTCVDTNFDPSYIRKVITDIKSGNMANPRHKYWFEDINRMDPDQEQIKLNEYNLKSENFLFERILRGIFYMNSIYSVKDGLSKRIPELFKFACEHMTLIFICKNGQLVQCSYNEINPLTYINVIMECLHTNPETSHYHSIRNTHITTVALQALDITFNMIIKLFGENTKTWEYLEIIDIMVTKLSHLCYHMDWDQKEGGCLAIQKMIGIFPPGLLIKFIQRILYALFYVQNHLTKHVTLSTVPESNKTLDMLIDKCYQEVQFTYDKEKNRLIVLEKEKMEEMGEEQDSKGEMYLHLFHVVYLLLRNLNSDAKFARTSAKRLLLKLKEHQKMSLGELLSIHYNYSQRLNISAEPAQKSMLETITEGIFRPYKFVELYKDDNMEELIGELAMTTFLLDPRERIINPLEHLDNSIALMEQMLLILETEIYDYELQLGEIEHRNLKHSAPQNTGASNNQGAMPPALNQMRYNLHLETYYSYFKSTSHYSDTSIIGHTIISEGERMSRINTRKEEKLVQQKLLAKNKGGSNIKGDTNEGLENTTKPDGGIENLMKKLLASNKLQYRKKMVQKADRYSYILFPKLKSRLKVLCGCVKVIFSIFRNKEFFKLMTAENNQNSEDDETNIEISPETINKFKDILQMKYKTVIILFKLLQMEEKCIIRVVKICFKQLLDLEEKAMDILPEVILKGCIRPILEIRDYHSEADYKCLKRLIGVLSPLFNNHLWENFKNNLKQLQNILEKPYHSSQNTNGTNPTGNVQQPTSSRDKASEIKVGACIICSFKMLPSTEGIETQTLPILVEKVLDLERFLPPATFLCNPLRKALAPFLNRFPVQSIIWFMKTHPELKHLALFLHIFELEESTNLREAMGEKTELIIDLLKKFSGGLGYGEPTAGEEEREIRGILLQIVHILADKCLGWIERQKNIIQLFEKIWVTNIALESIKSEPQEKLSNRRDYEIVIACFLSYCKKNRTEFYTIFGLLELLPYQDYLDTSLLKMFYLETLPDLNTCEECELTCKHLFTEFIPTRKSSAISLLDAISFLGIPALAKVCEIGNSSPGFVEEQIKNCVGLEPHTVELKAKLIQMLCLILEKEDTAAIRTNKHSIIKFTWSALKVEDPLTKHWALLANCYFFRSITIPANNMIEVFACLLTQYQPEFAHISNKALDIITPYLLKTENGGEEETRMKMSACKLLERVLKMNGNNLTQAIHVYHMFVRHEKLFYECRHFFYVRIVNALQRLYMYAQTFSHREVAVDIVRIILAWSKREEAEGKDRISNHIEVEKQVKYIIVHALIRLSTTIYATEDKEAKVGERQIIELSYKALVLLRDTFHLWSNIEIKLEQIKMINMNPEKRLQTLYIKLTLLNLMRIIFKYHDPAEISLKIVVLMQNLSPIVPIMSQNSQGQKQFQITEGLAEVFLKGLLISDPEIARKLSINESPTAATKEILGLIEQIIKKDLENSLKAITNSEERKTNQQRPPNDEPVESKYDQFPHLAIRFLQKLEEYHIYQIIDRYFFLFTECVKKLLTLMFGKKDNKKISGEEHEKWLKKCKEFRKKSDFSWCWLEADDEDIKIMNLKHFYDDYYNQESFIIALKLLSNRVEFMPHTKKDFLEIISYLQSNCHDELILIELIHITHRIIFANSQIPPENPINLGLHPLEKYKLLGKFLEHDISDNQHLELIYQYFQTSRDEMLKKLHLSTLMAVKPKGIEWRNKFFTLFDEYYGMSLHKRLQFIFHTQDWEYDPDAYWIKSALDLLLSAFDENMPLQKDTSSLKLFGFNEGTELENERNTPYLEDTYLDNLISSHSNIIEKIKKQKTKSWLYPIREIVLLNSQFSHTIWLKVFPGVWGLLNRQEQQHIGSLFEPLLLRSGEQRQIKKTNVLKTFIESLSACDPMPKIKPELLQYLAKNFNIWHSVIPILESSVSQFKSNERFSYCLSTLYNGLNEGDELIGLERIISSHNLTKEGLKHIGFEEWKEANQVFTEAISKYIKTGTRKVHSHPGGDDTYESIAADTDTVTQLDIRIWEKYWMKSSQQLNEWDNLFSIRKHPCDSKLMFNYTWNMRNWNNFKEERYENFHTSCQAILANLFRAIKDEKLEELEELIKKGEKTLHAYWHSLPNLVECSHYPVLRLFQQFAEIKESYAMIKDVKRSLRVNEIVDAKVYLNTWRQRLPCNYEPFQVWKDLLECRNSVFNIILDLIHTAHPNNSENIKQLNQDIPWNLLKLSQIARKHNLHGLAIKYIRDCDKHLLIGENTHYETFLRVSEGAKLSFAVDQTWGDSLDYLGKQISAHNLLFKNIEKGELYRLEGELHWRLGHLKEADNSFQTAVEVYGTSHKTWLSWAKFSDCMYIENKSPEWATSALSYYLNSICFKLSKSKLIIPKVLFLITNEALMESQFSVGKYDQKSILETFEKFVDQLPVWIWIFWLPQIMNLLGRTDHEIKIGDYLLKRLSSLYPQTVFYYLLRMVDYYKESCKKATASGIRINTRTQHLYEFVEAKFQELRLYLEKVKFDSMYKMISEIGKTLVQGSFREEFQKCIFNAIFKDVITKLYSQKEESLKEWIKKRLDDIKTKFFNNSNEQLRELRKEIIDKFEIDFSNEFLDKEPVERILLRLKHWSDFQQTRQVLTMQSYCLEQNSHFLVNFLSKGIELPGQYWIKDMEPSPETTLYITRFEPTYFIGDGGRKKFTIRGNNGKMFEFVALQAGTSDKQEQNLWQFKNLINYCYRKNKHTYTRSIKLYTAMHTYNFRYKIIQENTTLINCNNIYEGAMLENGCDPHLGLVLWINKYSEIKNELEALPLEDPQRIIMELEMRKQLYTEMKKRTNPFMLSGFLHKFFQQAEELFLFRKQFITYFGASNFLSYILGVGHKDLNALSICQIKGRYYLNDPKFVDMTQIPSEPSNNLHYETTNFRLTRNFQHFITEVGTEGSLTNVVSSCSMALQSKIWWIESFLFIYFKHNFNIRKLQTWTAAQNIIGEVNRLSQGNVERVKEKIFHIADSQVLKNSGFKMGKKKEEEEEIGMVEEANLGMSNKVRVGDLIKNSMDDANISTAPIETIPWF